MRRILYFNTKPNNLVHLFLATVIKVNYKINKDGKVYLDICTNKDHYIRDLERPLDDKLPFYILNKDIAIGDKINVYIQCNTETINKNACFVIDVVDPQPKNRKAFHTDQTTLTHCPVCGEKLYQDNNDLYCINNDCMAKLIFSIRRFLQIASPQVHWRLEELTVFGRLVTLGRIRSISDIYTLTENELTSSDLWIEHNRVFLGREVYKKINQTRGTVTVFNYLKSLNLPKHIHWKLNKDDIDRLFLSMADFLELIGDDNPRSFQKLRTCLDVEVINLLKNYFSQDKVLETIIKLNDECVFDS